MVVSKAFAVIDDYLYLKCVRLVFQYWACCAPPSVQIRVKLLFENHNNLDDNCLFKKLYVVYFNQD